MDPSHLHTAEPDPGAVDALFDALFDLSNEERDRALLAADVDESVRTRVRRLLAAADDPPIELDAPVVSAEFVEANTLPASIGPYAVRGLVGVGAMGVVYRAEQARPNREVALKIMRAAFDDDERAWRFTREAELLGRLGHPGIAQIFEAGTADLPTGTVAFIAMELVDGRPIDEHAVAQRCDRRARVRLLADVADAVHHAHLRGVIHRDLKPHNVLVTDEGAVKVIDFGVARADDGDGTQRHTLEGQVVGTLATMSPEQIQGRDVDGRSDVYSLGVMAFELLSGELPHDLSGKTLASAAQIITEHEARRLGRVAPDCRGDLDWVVGRALEKEPAARYQSAHSFARDLRRWLANEPVEAGPSHTLYRVRRFAARHRAAVVAGSITLLAILGGGITAAHFAIANGRLATSETLAREEAQRLQALAEERAAEITRRADPYRLDEAYAIADTLWPATPAMLPALDAWLNDYAEPLAESLAKHEVTLTEWRRDAAPRTDEDRHRDRETHPRAPELRRTLTRIEQTGAALSETTPSLRAEHMFDEGDVAGSLDLYEQLRAKLEAVVDTPRTFHFADSERQKAHDALTDLVLRLDEFHDPSIGLVADVEQRRATARETERRSLEGEAAAAWVSAREAIRNHPAYGGLDLPPQVGLIPLREDLTSGLWEFLHVTSGESPTPSRDPDATSHWELSADTGIVLVLVPGGAHRVGAQSTDPDGAHFDPRSGDTEGPVRDVDLPPYFISKYEATQAQWERLTGENPSGYRHTFRWFGEPRQEEPLNVNQRWNPVERVTWLAADQALQRVDLRLPSVVEWEVAARGGTYTPWWTGDTPAPSDLDRPGGNLADAWSREHGGPSHFLYEEWRDGWLVHAPAGTFPANPFGLHDTIGNVQELCADRLIPGTTDDVVTLRGGSFFDGARGSRVTMAHYVYETTAEPSLGVRPARSATGLAGGDAPGDR